MSGAAPVDASQIQALTSMFGGGYSAAASKPQGGNASAPGNSDASGSGMSGLAGLAGMAATGGLPNMSGGAGGSASSGAAGDSTAQEMFNNSGWTINFGNGNTVTPTSIQTSSDPTTKAFASGYGSAYGMGGGVSGFGGGGNQMMLIAGVAVAVLAIVVLKKRSA